MFASDASSEDWFGASVALSGDVAVVGAPGHDASGDGSDDGAVYVFQRNDRAWRLADRLEGARGDELGWSVAILGEYVMAGAPVERPAPERPNPPTGSAYVFIRHQGTWSQVARITPSNCREGDRFGSSVALSEGHAIVGATDTVPPLSDLSAAGSAYLFRK